MTKPPPCSNKACGQDQLHNLQNPVQNKNVGSFVLKTGESVSKHITISNFSFLPVPFIISWRVLFGVQWCSCLDMRITAGQGQTCTCAQGPLCGGTHGSPTAGKQIPLPRYVQGQRSHLPFLRPHCSNPQRTGNYQGTTTSLPGCTLYLDRWQKDSPSLTQLPSMQWNCWSRDGHHLPLPYDATSIH